MAGGRRCKHSLLVREGDHATGLPGLVLWTLTHHPSHSSALVHCPAGQSWSTVQYISTPDYEAGALKALLGVGDTADTATAFEYSCPPGDVLAGLSASTCAWLGQAGAVFCQLQFTCTHR